jgi:hypothetical protein
MCKRSFKPRKRGRLPSFCSATCKQRAYQQRKHSGPMVLLAQDLATVKGRDILRREIWLILRQAGLVTEPDPPPPPAPRRRRKPTHLSLVE